MHQISMIDCAVKVFKRIRINRHLQRWFLVGFCVFSSMQGISKGNLKITLSPVHGTLVTTTIQKAIDSCSANGGGVVVFPAGMYLSGGIELKSNVILQFEKGALLQGSDKYSDYQHDAFIYGKDLNHIGIQGKGIIDGVDCINPQGEEGFRGPHCIRLINCKKILLEGFTIKNSANWAINCRHCSKAKVNSVAIRGGHDGLHTRFCDHFTVSNCDFRTGDDAFAGNDNRNFVISDCKINTSCNGFRMGCYHFTVRRCHFWGPGESVHKIQKRNNMLSAFVHFSPKDENPQLKSGKWRIQDVTIEHVDQVYVYNYHDGLWQTGQPVTKVQFKGIRATGILAAFNIHGDTARQLNMNIKNSSFVFREGAKYNACSFEGARLQSASLFNAVNFNHIRLKKVTLEKKENNPLLNCKSGNLLIFNNVNLVTVKDPFLTKQVKRVRMVRGQ